MAGRSGPGRGRWASGRPGSSSSPCWSCATGSCQFFANFWQNVARFRLYRHQFLQENTRFAAFFKIYQIIKLKFLKFGKILQISRHLQNFAEFSRKLLIFQSDFLRAKRFFAKILRLQRCKNMQIL